MKRDKLKKDTQNNDSGGRSRVEYDRQRKGFNRIDFWNTGFELFLPVTNWRKVIAE